MSRDKEACVVLLDVGQSMHAHLPFAKRAVLDFLHQKITSKPAHEVALVFFGTTDTLNDLAEEMGEGNYDHVSMAQGIGLPDIHHLREVRNVEPGCGASDFVDALTVGVDMLRKAMDSSLEGAFRPQLMAKNVGKRVLLVSNFLTAAKGDPDDAFIPALITTLEDLGASLDVISLDIVDEDEAHLAAKNFNLNTLARIGSEVSRYSLRSARQPEDLLGVFRAKETTARAYYNGPLTIVEGKMLIKVKVTKKVSRGKWPELGKESPLTEPAPWAAAGEEEAGGQPEEAGRLERAREWVLVENEDEAVPPEEVAKAYRYGRDLMALDQEQAKALQYRGYPSSLTLLGFVERDALPRHHHMSDCWCCVASKDAKDDGRSALALATLVQAMHSKGQVAIMRFAPRSMHDLHYCAGLPVLGQAGHPPYLLLSDIPFTEDLRLFNFPTFDRPEKKPQPEAMEAARQLVAAMSLGEPPREQLAPEATPNCTLHAFINFLLEREFDAAAAPPAVGDPLQPCDDCDPLVRRVLCPRLGQMAGAEAALAAFREANPTQLAASKKAEGPLEEFRDRLERGEDLERAFGFARSEIINYSVSSDTFDQAAELLGALREESVARRKWQAYNEFWANLRQTCEGDVTKLPLWDRVVGAGLRLIDSQEVLESPVEPEDSEAQLQQVLGVRQAS